MDNKKNDIYYVEKMLKDMKFIIANTEDIPSICKRLDALLCLS